MTAPAVFCLCAHPRAAHDRGAGGCSRTACSCGKFRRSPVPVTPPTLEFRPGTRPQAGDDDAAEAGAA